MDNGFECDICGQTFGTGRGLKTHKTRIHLQSSEDQAGVREAVRMREQGKDGMPICRKCGQKYSTWDSFDRHLRRGVCHAISHRQTSSGCTNLSPSPSATYTSRRQQACQAPMLQNKSLIAALRDDWVDALDDQCGLKNMLSHHCVVCHQWFEKSWHLTHHGGRQHCNMFKEARLKYHGLLMERGIRCITRHCNYCDSTFQTGAEHKCVVVLQIALLLSSAPAPSDAACKRFRSRSCESRRRDEAVPGAASVEQDGRGRPRRRLRGKQKAPDQYESSAQRPVQGLGQRQDERDSVTEVGHEPSQNVSAPRRFDQCSTAGQRVYDLYEFWGGRYSSDIAQALDGLEGQASSGSIEHSITIEVDSVQGLYRGVDLEVGALDGERQSRSQRPHEKQHQEWHDGRTVQVCLPSLECRETRSREDFRATAEYDGCAQVAQRSYATARDACDSQVPCDPPVIREDELTSDSFLGRSRPSFRTSPEDLPDSDTPIPLLGHAVDRGISQAIHPPTQSASAGGQEADGSVLVGVSRACSEDKAARAASCWSKLPFENHTNVCYLNSVVNAIGWSLLHTTSLWNWGWLGRLVISVLGTQPQHLLENEVLKMMVGAWPSVHEQHDAGEFLGYLLKKTADLTGIEFGQWGARVQEGDAVGDRFVEPLCNPIVIALPLASSLSPIHLGALIRSWAGQTGQQALHPPSPPFLVLQVLRYSVVNDRVVKRTDQLSADSVLESVYLPVFAGYGLECDQCEYRVIALVVHHGDTPTCTVGHYTTLLRTEAGWNRKDDSRVSVSPQPTSDDLRNCYLLFLAKRS